jgi:hypothetical protein
VIETLVTADAEAAELPLENVNGIVTTNCPPNGCAAALWNHAAAVLPSGTLTAELARLEPAAGVKVKLRLVRS